MSIVPTQEQNDFRDAVATGENVKQSALAGSGKTTSVKMIAKDQIKKRILYAAFNRSIADAAAATFPSNTLCKTMHSLAYAKMGGKFQHRLNGPRVPSWKVQDFLRIPERFASETAPGLSLRGQQMARLIIDGVTRFCHSADDVPGPQHLPRVPGFDDPWSRSELQQFLYPYMQRAWDDLSSTNGNLKFFHDVYLKLWALERPQLHADIVVLDECQDANPLIHQIFISQTNSQLVATGDSQQQIYHWRGAIDVMDKLDFPHDVPLRQSFRFGPEIALEVNRILEALPTDLEVIGNPLVDSRLAHLETPTVVLTRTNAQAVARLMLAQMAGIRAGLVGGTYAVEQLAQAALDLREGKKSFHPDLLAFDNWRQVQDYVREDPDATDLQVLVRLVDTYGAEKLLEAVGEAVPEHDADMVISTAHKAKGREWDRVFIDQDFPHPFDEETGLPRYDEMRLAYVAVSRAQNYLDSYNLHWVGDYGDLDQYREFLSKEDVPERVVVKAKPAPQEQVVCDPEDATKLMFRRTPYSTELLAALKALPRRGYRTDYHGESKANLCLATRGALDVAEKFGLTVSEEAIARVEELCGE